MVASATTPADLPIKRGDEVLLKMSNVKLYQGRAVGVVLGTGYATPVVAATAGMRFVGVAEETVDNSAGSAGDKWIRVRRTGVVGATVTGATVASIGKDVFWADDNTLTTTPGNIYAGVLVALDSNGVGWVDITHAAGFGLFFNLTTSTVHYSGTTLTSSAFS